MNETIRININIDDRAVRDLNTVISDLNTTIGTLQSSISTFQGSFQTLSGELSSSSGAWGLAYSGASLLLGTLTLLAVENTHLKNIPSNIGKIIGAFTGLATKLTAKKGVFALLGGALKLLPWVVVAGGVGLFISALSNAGNNTETTRSRINRLNDTLEENRQAHRDAIDEIDQNERSSGALITTLLRLNNRTGDLNDERDEAIRLIKILNAAENGLNLTYDEQTSFLSENSVAALEQEQNRIAMNASLERSNQHFKSLEESLLAEYEANYENRGELERLRQTRETLNEELAEANKLGFVGYDTVARLTSALSMNEQELAMY